MHLHHAPRDHLILQRLGRRYRTVGLLAVLLAATGIAVTGIAMADGPVDGPASSATMRFDIPAQPLGSAMAAFGAVSGLEIIADARQAHGRMSSPVTGTMAPWEALQTLLAGTGFSISSYAPGSVKPVAPPSPPEPVFLPATSPHAAYFAEVQQAVMGVVCRDQLISPETGALEGCVPIGSAASR